MRCVAHWRKLRATNGAFNNSARKSGNRRFAPKNCAAKELPGLSRHVPDSDHRVGRCQAAAAVDSGPGKQTGATCRWPLDRQFETVRSVGRPNERKMIYESKRDFAD